MNTTLLRINNNILPKILLKSIQEINYNLNEDIKSYLLIKQLFIIEYQKLYTNDKDEYLEFLTYDLYSFINNDTDISTKYEPQFYDFWKKLYCLKNKDTIEIVIYVYKLKKKNYKTQINIILSLLTPDERIKALFLNSLRYCLL